MVEKRIGIIEDNQDWIDRIKEIATKEGFSIAFIANSLRRALEVIADIGRLDDVDIITLDGNLGGGESNQDAEIILGSIRPLYPDLVIIGLSGVWLPIQDDELNISGVTVNLRKQNIGDLATKLKEFFPKE